MVFTLNFWTLVCYALGHEFQPRWQQTIFRTQAQHLCFIHDAIWFVWFDTFICLLNLSCELWNRKLKLKEIYLKKSSSRYSTPLCSTISPLKWGHISEWERDDDSNWNLKQQNLCNQVFPTLPIGCQNKTYFLLFLF